MTETAETLEAAQARIAALEAELAGAREALERIAAVCKKRWLLADVPDHVSAINAALKAAQP